MKNESLVEMITNKLPKNPWKLISIYRTPTYGELWNKWIPELQCGAVIRPGFKIWKGVAEKYYAEFYKKQALSIYFKSYSLSECKQWADEQFAKIQQTTVL